MSPIAWTSWGVWALVVLLGWLLRSRPYAIFRGVTLGIHNLIVLALLPHVGSALVPLLVLHGLVFLQSLLLVRPRLRSLGFRLLISWPALAFSAGTLMAFPWAIAAAFGLSPLGLWVPAVLTCVGMFQSLRTRKENVLIQVGDVTAAAGIARTPPVRGTAAECVRPLRIVQITDPHLGPFMSVERLRSICARAVEADPDLVVLTGDFLTMESQGDARWLTDALSPLRALSGRVVACLGNHDHEAPAAVLPALSAIGAELLVDACTRVATPAGPIQILGFDFHFSGRAEKTAEILARYPRDPDALRLVLLHDPGAFRHIPAGEVDLVLSGHTHGGQVGLVSLGLDWTVAWAVAKIPDHGLWGHGRSRLYVHRGTGHYGFPLRLGVPAEESVLSVQWLRSGAARQPRLN